MWTPYYSLAFFAIQSSSASIVTRSDNQLQKRATLTCPEDIGGVPWSCSADFCGGEDHSAPGFCAIADPSTTKCRCTTIGATAVLSEKTITATQTDGATAVGVYALQTISSYASLRQAITTTITETTTATNGNTGVETAAAIVFAGGVSWFLVSLVGDAIAGEAIEPPTTESAHPDDTTCPNPAQKCSDCTGAGGMCTTGSASGCACKETTCPAPPQCSDSACAGNAQNQCTASNAGCDCTPDATCPDDVNTLDCSSCGGGGGNEICVGLANNKNQYQGCQCIGSINSTPYQPDVINSAADDQTAFAALPNWDHWSFAQIPNLVPTCRKAGWYAPQRDSDGSPSVTSSFTQWCAAMDGQTVTQNPGVDTVFAMYKFNYYSYWLSAHNWYGAPTGNQCGNKVTISKEECIKIFTAAMDTCDPNSGATHGASFQGECISYNITLSPSTDPASPPWNPLPAAANGICDLANPTDVTLGFFKGVYPQFCSQLGSTTALSADLTQKDFKAVSSRSLSIRTPPTSSGMLQPAYGNNWIFHFDFSGANGDCRKSCTDAYYALSQSCGNTMSDSGYIEAGCGTYGYTINPPDQDETICAIAPSWYDLNPATTFTVDHANDAISKFCADTAAIVSNPMQTQPFVQNIFTDTPSYPFRYYLYGTTVIEIWAAFADTVGVDSTGCKADAQFVVGSYENRCKAVLGKVLSRCNADTTTAKKGGFTTEHDGTNGCVVWQIFAYEKITGS